MVSNQSGLLTDSCAIYYYEKISNLMTSEPLSCEVVVKLLMMKSSNKKNQDARDGNAPLIAADENFSSSRWWRRGRFGLLYYSYGGGGDVVLVYSILPTATTESVRWKSFVLLIYYHEKASNLTTLEPSPCEVVCRVVDGEAKLYKKSSRRARQKRPARCSAWDGNFRSSRW